MLLEIHVSFYTRLQGAASGWVAEHTLDGVTSPSQKQMKQTNNHSQSHSLLETWNHIWVLPPLSTPSHSRLLFIGTQKIPKTPPEVPFLGGGLGVRGLSVQLPRWSYTADRRLALTGERGSDAFCCSQYEEFLRMLENFYGFETDLLKWW